MRGTKRGGVSKGRSGIQAHFPARKRRRRRETTSTETVAIFFIFGSGLSSRENGLQGGGRGGRSKRSVWHEAVYIYRFLKIKSRELKALFLHTGLPQVSGQLHISYFASPSELGNGNAAHHSTARQDSGAEGKGTVYIESKSLNVSRSFPVRRSAVSSTESGYGSKLAVSSSELTGGM